MSYSASNRRASNGGNPVSLFPFLAVLLCTMGALITVLLIMARQAQLTAEAEIVAEEPDSVIERKSKSDSEVCIDEELPVPPTLNEVEEKEPDGPSVAELEKGIRDARRQIDLERWRVEELKKVRLEAEKELQKTRIALSTTQENQKRVAGEMRTLREALIRLEEQRDSLSRDSLEAEIAAKKAQLEKLLAEFEKAENTAQKQNGSYAILPHVGPNGTRRYPIYIECREDGAWLMPENVKLAAGDFEGVLSMENPLEMALMTKRQYLLKNGVFQETSDGAQEPYPLIIVRPGGILYLYMVKEALQSWKSEFGYELVEDSLSVAYPPNDELLKQEMQKAIQAARVRQQEIAAMAPTLPQTSAGTGGSVVYHPNSRGGNAVQIDQNSRLARTLRRSSEQSAEGAALRNKMAATGTTLPASLNPDSPSRAQTAGAYGTNAADGTYTSDSGTGPNTNSVSARAAKDLTLWEAASSEKNQGNGNGNATSGSTSSTSAGTPAPQGPASQFQNPNIAQTEGQNWALENYHPSMTSLTRPVQVECRKDRIILCAAPGTDAVTIMFEQPIPTVKRLAKEITGRIKGWGDAGAGVYWKPVLRVRVAPDARAEYEQLLWMLEGSGLTVEERTN